MTDHAPAEAGTGELASLAEKVDYIAERVFSAGAAARARSISDVADALREHRCSPSVVPGDTATEDGDAEEKGREDAAAIATEMELFAKYEHIGAVDRYRIESYASRVRALPAAPRAVAPVGNVDREALVRKLHDELTRGQGGLRPAALTAMQWDQAERMADVALTALRAEQ